VGVTVKRTGNIPTKVWDEKSSASLAKKALSKVQDRAFNKGLDVNDRKFKPYSKSSGKTGPVDLTETGRLKASLEVSDTSETGFSISTDVPYAGFVNESRAFMGLSDDDMKSLKDDIEKSVEAAMLRSTK
jgi:phage gpG-like protein